LKFNEFLDKNRGVLLGYYLLEKEYPGKFILDAPFPPEHLSEEELEVLKETLNQYMPLDSSIIDLWDWDIHFESEAHLSNDWYFETTFGDSDSLNYCSSELADFILEKIEEDGMDYAQEQWDTQEEFGVFIKEMATDFIHRWRMNIDKGIGS
jgi:hypothetical protein